MEYIFLNHWLVVNFETIYCCGILRYFKKLIISKKFNLVQNSTIAGFKISHQPVVLDIVHYLNIIIFYDIDVDQT